MSLLLDRIVEKETLRSQIKAFDDTNEILLLKEEMLNAQFSFQFTNYLALKS